MEEGKKGLLTVKPKMAACSSKGGEIDPLNFGEPFSAIYSVKYHKYTRQTEWK